MMRFAALAVLFLTACNPADTVRTGLEPKPVRESASCKGELQEVSGMNLIMKCDDGRTFQFLTYKYNFNRLKIK